MSRFNFTTRCFDSKKQNVITFKFSLSPRSGDRRSQIHGTADMDSVGVTRWRPQGPGLVALWALLLHAGAAGLSADCPAGERLGGAPVHAGGSCLLTGRVDTSSAPSLRLAFADAGGSATGAEIGIEVRGVVERAAGIKPAAVACDHDKFTMQPQVGTTCSDACRARGACAAMPLPRVRGQSCRALTCSVPSADDCNAALPQMGAQWASKGLAARGTRATVLKTATSRIRAPPCWRPSCRGATSRRKWMAP